MKKIKNFLKGLWIGSTMTVPGVSGGTMAIIVGIYEDLIHALNGVRQRPKKYIMFLSQVAIGAGIGIIVFARFITMLLESGYWGVPVRFLFCGIVAGSIPFLAKKAEIKKISVNNILYIAIGIILVILVGNIPNGIFQQGDGIIYFFAQIFGGILIAIAVVLPGISVTHMLYIMGLYEVVIERICSFQIMALLPMLLGILLGTFTTADIIEKLMSKNSSKIYMIILGFVIGSVWELIPKETIHNPIVCMLMSLFGLISMYNISAGEK